MKPEIPKEALSVIAGGWLSIKAVALLVDVSESTISNLMVTDGFPQPFSIGKNKRWSKVSIESWMKKKERAAL